MIRAVLDTNIVVSGLLFGGIPRQVVNAGVFGRYTLVTSAPLMDEVERVLHSKKFDLREEEVTALIRPVFAVAEVVVPVRTIHAIPRCPADNRVLECAVDGHCHVIVTGDRRDLISLGHYQHIQIITARQFLASDF